MTTRRAILAGGLTLGLARLLGAQDSLAGRGATGTLRDPGAAGRPRDPSTARDNDPFIYTVEHRIKCQCGCNLDVYTCRTTDFTCTFSPALHKEVLALHDEGKDADEIVAAFVAKYGEKILMAPPKEGFNWAGYLFPGIAITLAGIAIGLSLTLIHLIGIPVTNLSVNPARSTGPAVFVGGWALGQLWLFWVAPILGAALAGGFYAWLGGESDQG